MTKKSGEHSRDIELLYEMGSLACMDRGWRQHFGMKVESDLEHMYRVVWLALLIARMEGSGDEALIMKMALMHDLAESRTGDASYVQKVYVTADEDRSASDMLAGTSFPDFYDAFARYEKRDSIEAKLVKDADNLEVDLELKELEERGSLLPKKLADTRRKVRDEKLYTKSAKELWDAIQVSDVSSWHRAANKWVKLPHAGR
ncbi:MAG: HD domain-containing protein [Patescibacteria group bacterium]|nr:HD domain-containing protein [Patescibacteria group bacterium]MDE1965941.1 HD domain-containing protein [Patescibacteria group bacterium]